MVERHFDDELAKLNTHIVKMAALTEEAIYRSIEALKNRDKDLAKDVIEADKKIDELENMVDDAAVRLLAIRQPVADELRFVTTAVKINTDLERIADLAVNISQRVLTLADEPLLKPLIDIPKLSEAAREMVKKAIDSFINRNEDLAKEVIFTDPEINRLKNAIQDELVNDYMAKDLKTVPRAVQLLLVARHLERMCDHATNIAEDVIFMVGAHVVKHRKIED